MASTAPSMPEREDSFFRRFLRSQFTALPYPSTSFADQTIIITGANTGLGLEAARHIARLGATTVILAVRDLKKGHAAKVSIEASTKRTDKVVEVWQLDLAHTESVRAFAERANGLKRLDAVIENAGMVTEKFQIVNDGHSAAERTIAVNVINTFLLALLLLPKLHATASDCNTIPRLVIVGSEGYEVAAFKEAEADDIFAALADPARSDMEDRYNTSKLLSLYGVLSLSSHLPHPTNSKLSPTQPGITLTTPTPGFCRSSLLREAPWYASWINALVLRLLGRSAEVGSRTLVHAAEPHHPETHGRFLRDCHVEPLAPFVRGERAIEVRERVYAQLMERLERVAPGVTDLLI
ncbi:MAG: hypothetical protein M1819_007260 [Sarea resinae]|nr:MAG: hypothetical protein M1819_007260 [Sarea resinae]